MKKSLVLAMAMALGVTASAYAANPFSDVPAGHWAYDSVNKLTAAGVVDGYGDGTFGGDKLMTRYEMAQIVARAMANGANVDKLAAEFADELDALGVRVAALEKKADAVKITGNIRYHYKRTHGNGTGNDDENKLRSRIFINGQINDDWKYTGMLENIQDFGDDQGNENTAFQRAFVSGKLGGLAVEGGRNNLSLVGSEVHSNRADFIKASYGKEVKLTAIGGKLSNNSGIYGEDFYAGILSAKLGVVNAEITYVDVENQKFLGKDNNIWVFDAKLPVAKDLTLEGVYLLADEDDANKEDDGFIVKLNYKGAKANKAGSYGIFAKYYDLAGTTYLSNGNEDGFINDADLHTDGFKGYQIGANYAFAKNIVGEIEYAEFKDQKTDDKKSSLWTEVVFTF